MVERMLWLLLASIIPMWVVEAEASLKAALGRRGYTGTQAEIKFLADLETFAEAEYEHWIDRLWSPDRKIDNHLKQWLFKHGYLLGVKPELLAVVAENWAQLSTNQRKQIADASQLSAEHIVWLVKLGADAPRTQGRKLASALDKLIPSKLYPEMGEFGRVVERAYSKYQPQAGVWYERWQASLAVPELFPVGDLRKEGKYTLRIIPRENPERLFAGSLTNCCQHPAGPGKSAAWFAQEAPNATILALYKGDTMVAQSFVWSYEGVWVLDNVEALSKEMGDKLVELLAISRRNFRVGTDNNDLSNWVIQHCFVDVEDAFEIPEGLGYSDAEEQWKPTVVLRNMAYFKRPYILVGRGKVWGISERDLPVVRDNNRTVYLRTVWNRVVKFQTALKAAGLKPQLTQVDWLYDRRGGHKINLKVDFSLGVERGCHIECNVSQRSFNVVFHRPYKPDSLNRSLKKFKSKDDNRFGDFIIYSGGDTPKVISEYYEDDTISEYYGDEYEDE